MTTGGIRKAWLGLGGNIGDPVAAMGRALCALDARADTRVLDVSSVYRTPPWGKTDQDWFRNACAEVETGLAPVALLEACLDIERQMKRQRAERWGPRTIDIDVLMFEGVEALQDPALTLPHPRMTERAFVLVPLAEIAPGLKVNGRTVAEWRADCDLSGIEKARDDAGWWKRFRE
ncbi:2-amino-4-hydroxy-6-hydroxymethyldihydropteridine diphosphokinase [Mesorhizobium sp. RMAD-H1]|uniref:2-amino-4-hydroxy-6- hydroxymethyldihydropteridine diphosphokinase n=1 Tax=Mesorhizobium sp. RMAD-H1 TaxID=2587065 RepID=UPI001609DC4D|nr:2-amino-4-hydroxy-6-hydroxymethyldihydropteridine diphosphokinase [Mesorhizobium sp. RMAD-H1]MBB2970299.1 2-amino-4-hydroxy-6-hydroxymethyldihydropteridine diphosphokinase [Mesorhizobium sp. RMAD-H1]